MNDTEKTTTESFSFSHFIFWLAFFLSVIGFGSIFGLFGQKESGAMTPQWGLVATSYGLYIGPSIPRIYEDYKTKTFKPSTVSLNIVIRIFLLLGFLQWGKFIWKMFDADTFTIDFGKLLMSIFLSQTAFGLARKEKGWWITGIVLTLLPLAFWIFLLSINIYVLLSNLGQLTPLVTNIALFLGMLAVLISPKTRRLFRKPDLNTQTTSA